MAGGTEVIDLSSDSDDVVELSATNTQSGNSEIGDILGLDANGNGISIKVDSPETNAIGITLPSVTSVTPKTVNNACNAAVKKLLDVVTPLVKKQEKDKISAKIDKKLGYLNKDSSFTEELEKVLISKIENASGTISSKTDNVWKELDKLFRCMAVDQLLVDTSAASSHTAPSSSTAQFRRKIAKLELKLKTLERRINEWDEKEVDLDDETNSAYLVKTRMVNHYMKHWNMLCDLQKFSRNNTGRAIHKKISKEDVTNFPEINEAVFTYLNSRIMENCYYFPDYHDILEVVTTTTNSSGIFLDNFEIHKMAKEIFPHIVTVLRKRRLKDYHVAINQNIEDPADKDPELLKELENNRLQGKREEDVITEFVEKQREMKLEAVEVTDESPDLSPPNSDTETENEDDDNDSDLEILSTCDDDEGDLEINGVEENGETVDHSHSGSDSEHSYVECGKKPRLEESPQHSSSSF